VGVHLCGAVFINLPIYILNDLIIYPANTGVLTVVIPPQQLEQPLLLNLRHALQHLLRQHVHTLEI
jgi:hypothetical protein